MSAYAVTELTPEEAFAASGGQACDVCDVVIVDFPDGSFDIIVDCPAPVA